MGSARLSSALFAAALALALVPIHARASATLTWQGGGGNANWSNGANWVGGVAPSPGDALDFPATVSATSTNDLTGYTFSGITISRGVSDQISGNALSLTGPLTFDASGHPNNFSLLTPITFDTGGGTVDVVNDGFELFLGSTPSGVLTKTGNGTLSVNGLESGASAVEIAGGMLGGCSGNQATSAPITVDPGATFIADGTCLRPLTISGTGYLGIGAIATNPPLPILCCTHGNGTLGDVALAADAQMSGNVSISGTANLGGHSLAAVGGNSDAGNIGLTGHITGGGSFSVTAGGLWVSSPDAQAYAFSDSSATLGLEQSVLGVALTGTSRLRVRTIDPNEIAASYTIGSGGLVLPSGSTFETEFDLAPSGGSDLLTVNGGINVGGASLLVDWVNSGSAAPVGQAFPILTSPEGLTGTFAGLPDGAELVVAGMPLIIHYTPTAVTLTRIQQAATTTTLTSSANPTSANQFVQLYATVATTPSTGNTPTGSIKFEDGGTPISGCSGIALSRGYAGCIPTFTTPGTHNLTAVYSGDTNDAPSTSAAVAQSVSGVIAPTTLTWQGGATNDNWSTAANWVGNVPFTDGDSVVFPSSANITTNDDLATATLGGITFSGSGYQLAGNAFALSGPLTVDGTVSSGTDTISPQVSFVSGGGSVSVANDGVVLDLQAAPAGPSTLDKTGNGTLDAEQLNTGTNPVVVSGGVLAGSGWLNHPSPSSIPITVMAGASYIPDALTSNWSYSDRPIVLNGTGYLGQGAVSDVGFFNFIGGLTLGSDALIKPGPSGATWWDGSTSIGGYTLTTAGWRVAFFAQVTGTGAIVSDATDTELIAGNNTFSGTVSATSGHLVIVSTDGNVNASGTAHLVAGSVTGGSPGSIGSLTMSGRAILEPAASNSQSGNPLPSSVNLLSGGLTLPSTSTFIADLGVSIPTGVTTLNVQSGAVDIQGATLQVSAGTPTASTTQHADRYTILTDPNGITGTFAGLPNGATLVGSDNKPYAVTYTPTSVILTQGAPPIFAVSMDAFGGIHSFGDGQVNTAGAPYWSGWAIARGVVMLPQGAGGYTLDGWGGVHPWGSATTSLSPVWPGWDIARGIALNPCDPSGSSGYFLDGWGGVHPFGGAPTVTTSSYWAGWDIAKGLALNPCAAGTVTGYVLDGWGGLHSFSSGAPVAKPSGGAYWAGWNIARAVVVTASGEGYVLDGWGGLHPFGGATGFTTAYWNGWDIARSVIVLPPGDGGYTLDGWGGVHPFGSAPAPPNATPTWPGWDVDEYLASG